MEHDKCERLMELNKLLNDKCERLMEEVKRLESAVGNRNHAGVDVEAATALRNAMTTIRSLSAAVLNLSAKG